MKRLKTILTIALIKALVVLPVLLTACGAATEEAITAPESQSQTLNQTHEQSAEAISDSHPENMNDIGEGANVFTFKTIDGDGNESIWRVHTGKTTVGEALVEVGLIDGENSEFGMMVSHVNGIRADFVEDDAWWAFYIDDEMAMVGVDSADIEEGITYAFIYTPA